MWFEYGKPQVAMQVDGVWIDLETGKVATWVRPISEVCAERARMEARFGRRWIAPPPVGGQLN